MFKNEFKKRNETLRKRTLKIFIIVNVFTLSLKLNNNFFSINYASNATLVESKPTFSEFLVSI